jgi:hypothetical protein
VRLPIAALLAGSLAATVSCRKPCDYQPTSPPNPFLVGRPSNQEQTFWVHATAPMGSCDEGSPEFREVRMAVFDEEGQPVPPSRIEYVYDGVYPHSTTELYSLEYWLTVPRGGDYRFRASFPDAGWPDQGYTYIVPQHHDAPPAVVLPARCSSVGSLGPDLWLCDGALFRGDKEQWAAAMTDGGVAISRAVDGIAWVHTGHAVYRFKADATAGVQSVSLGRSYEALTATADELFLQSPAGLARVTFDGQALAAAEADFPVPLAANDEYQRFDVPSLVHGVQASSGKLASLWMYGRGKVRACRWAIPSNGLPVLSSDDCVDENVYLAGVGSSGAWIHNGSELRVLDYTTTPPTGRYARPFNMGEDALLYRTNRRWFGGSARPKSDGSIAFDHWDIPNDVTSIRQACAQTRWDAEDDLAWVACGFAPSTNPVYTLVWRRSLGAP